MATLSDIIQSIDFYGDSTTTDVVIREFLDDPVNGFFNTEPFYAQDGTTVLVYVFTSPRLTVDQWKTEYYEVVVNDKKRARRDLVITNNYTPQYPVPDFEALTDATFDSGGVSVIPGDYIQYEYFETRNVYVGGIWLDSTGTEVYFSYSRNGEDWFFLKAEADHTLDANGKLLEATDSTDAAANYLIINGGTGEPKIFKFPHASSARFTRVHFLTACTIHEIAFREYSLAEQQIN